MFTIMKMTIVAISMCCFIQRYTLNYQARTIRSMQSRIDRSEMAAADYVARLHDLHRALQNTVRTNDDLEHDLHVCILQRELEFKTWNMCVLQRTLDSKISDLNDLLTEVHHNMLDLDNLQSKLDQTTSGPDYTTTMVPAINP